MADIAGSYVSPYSSPTFTHVISYSQTGRTGTDVTYAFTIKSNMGSSQSTFGYSMAYSLTINGKNFTGTMKNASPTWTGTTVYTTSFTVTVPCGTGGGTLSAQLWVTRPGNEGNSGKIDTGAQTVTVSAWNTAPYWTSGASCSVSPSGTIAENVTSLTVSWTGASDTEGNTRYYTVKRYVKGVYSATIATNITGTSCMDNIGSGNQGYTYYYVVSVSDGSLTASSTLTSNTVTKNTFTTANISTSSSVGYSTGSVSFAISGAKNTNNNGTFYYTLTCDKITVYNANGISSAPTSVSVYRTGTAPSTPYVKFDDIKNATRSASFQGTFTFTLKTQNAYGSNSTKTCTMKIDLRTNPSAISSVTTSGTYNIGGTNYYIPNKKAISVSWGASTDYLGGTMTYDVQYKLGSGSYVTVKSKLTTTSTSFTLSAVGARTACVVRVIARTSFGYTVLKDSSSITLDYYNPPTITFSPVVRNINDVTVNFSIKYNTSIPSASLSISSLSYKGKSGTTTSLTTTVRSVKETGLSETQSYTFTLTALDNAGTAVGQTAVSQSVSVPKYMPVLSVREKGVGINAVNTDSSIALLVGGDTVIKTQTKPILLLQAMTNVQNDSARVIFNGADNQAVRIRFNEYDSVRAPFGLHIERADEYNTATTLKAYLEVEGEIISGGGITSGGNIKVESSVVPTITLRNSSNGDTSLIFDRNTSANWRLRVTGGALLFESDYTTGKTSYYEAMRLDYNSGNLTVKGQVSMDSGSKVVGRSTGVANTAWLGFYESNGTVRQGYVGMGSSTSNNVFLRSDLGNVVLQTGADGLISFDAPAFAKQNAYWLDVGDYGLNMRNSDIIGLNNLIFSDPTNSDVEGIQFVKTGKDGSKVVTDYDTLRALDGRLYFNSSDVVGYGTNSNGSYVWFYDGTMICWISSSTSMTINNAYGSLWQNTLTWTYPSSFKTPPTVSCSHFQYATGAAWGSVSDSPTATTARLRAIDAVQRSTAGSCVYSAIAIGRWK